MTPKQREAKGQHDDPARAGAEGDHVVEDRTGASEARKSDPEALRRDIEQTRAELGETVEALGEKADVKAQAKATVEERKEAVREKQEQAREKASALRQRVSATTPEEVKAAGGQVVASAQERPLPAIAGAFAAGFAVAWLTKRS